MVNVSTPAGYVEIPPPVEFQFEAPELITSSGIVASQTYFLELRMKEGVKIGGEQTYSNIKLYGVNDVSSTNQDVEIYVDQGVQDQANKGQISIYAGSLVLNTDYHIVHNGAVPTPFYDINSHRILLLLLRVISST